MMPKLPLNGDVLVPELLLGHLDVLDPLLRDVLGDVLAQVLNCVVVSNGDLLGYGLYLPLLPVLDLLHLLRHSLYFRLVLVIDDLLLEGHVLDPALAFYHFFARVYRGAHYLAPARDCGRGRSSAGVVSCSNRIILGNCARSSPIDSSIGRDVVGSGRGNIIIAVPIGRAGVVAPGCVVTPGCVVGP